MTDTLADRIKQRLDFLGKTENSASLEATGKKDTIRMIRTGRTKAPRTDTLSAIARVLETSEQWLLHGDGDPTVAAPVTQSDVSEPIAIPNVRDLPKDVPVFGTVSGSMSGGEDGAWQLGTDPVDYVRRPPGIMNTKMAYALFVENFSMSPKYEPGDLIYVNPTRPARPGDFVIVQMQNGENAEREAYIKKLVRRTSTEVVCEQFNPADTVRFPISVLIHRVMTTSELMSV